MGASARNPVLPEATVVGALSAQSRRPWPRSATSAIRRLRPSVPDIKSDAFSGEFVLPPFSSMAYADRMPDTPERLTPATAEDVADAIALPHAPGESPPALTKSNATGARAREPSRRSRIGRHLLARSGSHIRRFSFNRACECVLGSAVGRAILLSYSRARVAIEGLDGGCANSVRSIRT